MAEFPHLPLFTDAYLADTRHLTTEEHGAYLLLMMEAWRRPDCNLPDDDMMLARLSGLSLDRWEEIKPVVMAFWKRDGRRKVWTQKRLLKERGYVSEKSKSQRDKATKRWNKSKKADAAALPRACPEDAPTPTPTPSLTTFEKDDVGGSARASDKNLTIRERLLWAAGIDPQSIIDKGPGAKGGDLDMAEVKRWLDLFKGDADAVVQHVASIRSGMNDPPNTLRYFTKPLQKIAGAKSAPPLTPIEGTPHAERQPAHDRRTAAADDAFAERVSFAARNRSPTRSDFGFG